MQPTPSSARIHQATIYSNEPVATGVYKMVFSAPALAKTMQPGQFFSIAVPGELKQQSRIPLSPSRVEPDAIPFQGGTVETIYQIVGPGTRALSRMKPYDTTTVLGPGGHGWRLDGIEGDVLLVSGGVGIAPVISAARALKARGACFDAVVGARTESVLAGIRELEEQHVRELVVTTDDGTAGLHGFTTDGMAGLLETKTYSAVLTCGPEPMMKRIAAMSAEKGIPCQVSLERTMTCGFGACATCTVPTVAGPKGACMHGPVFDAEEVVWQ
jgi:dihydroorotate dehydrogenase electron transfer subunit